MKRYWPPILLIAGTVLAMLSIGLDLTSSSNGAEPQSMRGYESIHGSVTFTIATLLLLAGLLTIWPRSTEPRTSRLIAIAMGLGAIGTAIIYGTSEPLLIVLVALGAAALVSAAIVTGPAELTANRMLILSTIAGGVAVVASAGASRNDLLAEQLASSGVADQYGDTSLAIGYYIALLGFFLALVGASAMWQQRREAISA